MGSPALFAQSAAIAASATVLVAFVYDRVSRRSAPSLSAWRRPANCSPSASPGGLQVFHCNGSKPMTHYTGALTKTAIVQSCWDNAKSSLRHR